MSLTFDALRAANEARQKEWDTTPGGLSLEFKGLELSGEVGELNNLIKKLVRYRNGLAGGVPDLPPIMDELGDVIICTDLLAAKLGVNLGKAVAIKFNTTSAKHGFKERL